MHRYVVPETIGLAALRTGKVKVGFAVGHRGGQVCQPVNCQSNVHCGKDFL
jgi:hypothetical protein